MRFINNGPSVPDELLLARDQGRVVFFCGAGVSRAKAKLPDFFSLAKKVTNTLGVQEDSSAKKILEEARTIRTRTGVDGVISADRIFGLLERDFLSRDIEAAVASALKPQSSPDISAHKTLLTLATTREGLVRLVTTNFDRLFDQCNVELPSFQLPKLPDPSRPSEFHGLVYLHGKATSEYHGAEGDGFVLSSSEFGRAYLSDGWATSFFREIIDRYFVVFVGYAADDPPVHYLLEALNKTAGQLEGVYAFQSGDSNYANSRWQHKGVEAIPYDEAGNHSALWNTLDAWATRAIDPEAWITGVVEKAKNGPEQLQSHERGQVAHVVSTVEGLRKFSEGDSPPPATWLCVFDPHRRYSKPGHEGSFSENGPYVDPFDLYGLDSDVIPNKIDPEDHYAKREIPNGTWDAFTPNKLDRLGLRDDNYSSIRGHWADHMPRLPSRLGQLSVWMTKIANQPEAVWWAVRQSSLHPDIRQQISWELERTEREVAPSIRNAWRYLFDFWSEDRGEYYRDWHQLGAEIKKSGWSEIALRKYAAYARPYLEVKENFWGGPIPPKRKSDIELGDLVRLDVAYPDPPRNFEIPDDWLQAVIVQLRKNLEIALELETEIGGYSLRNISPINPDDNPDGDGYMRTHGLSAWVICFIRHFERLLPLHPEAAKSEFEKWPSDDVSIFARLRIWGAGKKELVADDGFATAFANIPNEAFWDSYHSRDLLFTLLSRWNDLKDEPKKELEQRLVEGPERWENEEDEHFVERKAWSSVNRLNWLDEHGCKLLLDIDSVTKKLRKAAPKWKPEYAKEAAHSLEGRTGWVRTETEHSVLLQEPLETTLSKAEELAGRQGMEFVEHDPFAGLSADHPVRAFAALRARAKNGEYPEWAWRTFLNPDRRKNDNPKFTAFIAEQISRYDDNDISGFIRPAADWLQKSTKILASDHPELFSKLMKKLSGVLFQETGQSSSAIIRGSKEPDWTMEAINSPTGDLAKALFDDPRKDNLKTGDGFPKPWLQHVETLLALPGDLRRHALVLFTHNLSWFFAIDPEWTKKHLLKILKADSEADKQAFWSGFLWGGKAHGHELFEILKPHMLHMAKSSNLEKRGHAESLTGLLLSAWGLLEEGTGTRWVTNDELRDVLLNSNDDVRSQILWEAERWSSGNEEDGNQRWSSLLVELLRDVWPRQIAAKSATVSARLCDVAFSNEERFPELAKIVLPLLTKIDKNHLMLPKLKRSKDNIVDLHPHETLALLHAVLPDNVAAWPYGIESTLARIGEADNSLNGDERLLELRRKWDSR